MTSPLTRFDCCMLEFISDILCIDYGLERGSEMQIIITKLKGGFELAFPLVRRASFWAAGKFTV